MKKFLKACLECFCVWLQTPRQIGQLNEPRYDRKPDRRDP